MSITLERRLIDTLKQTRPRFQIIKDLVEQDVDCNLSYFDPASGKFEFPICLAAENDRHTTFPFLSEHRNAPTIEQLAKHVMFYINHHDGSAREENETVFDYTISRLLYIRLSAEHPKRTFDTLIVALHGFDGARYGTESLTDGSRQITFLQLRIYSLFRKLIDLKLVDHHRTEITIIERELCYNLETYYLLVNVQNIPLLIVRGEIIRNFSETESNKSLLLKYYQPIARNVIRKIEELHPGEEYTIPTGWIKHAVCLSFRRITETHILIRVDNSTSQNPEQMHDVESSQNGRRRIKPRILGQLNVDKLHCNLTYFVLLIGSVHREWPEEQGSNLIYNRRGIICGIEPVSLDHIPSFDEQAEANCVFKSFEAGMQIRFGLEHPDLYQKLLLFERNTANTLARRVEEESSRRLNDLYQRFSRWTEELHVSCPPETEKKRLQSELKTSYTRSYRYLSSDGNRDVSPLLQERYVPLRFEHNSVSKELKHLLVASRVLMLGDAGCGKTTVCQYITHSWAAGNLWRKQFEWLFYIKMRNFNSRLYPERPEEYTMADILIKECFSKCRLNQFDKQRLTNLLEHSCDVLWILDGCDERAVPGHLQAIERELLTKPHLLLTSRPHETYQFQCDARVQVQTFTEEDIKKYIDNYFSLTFRSTAKDCRSFVRRSEQLLPISCVPACLEIICRLWGSAGAALETGLKIGQLYREMCEYLLRRYLLKFHGRCRSALVGTDIYQIPEAIVFVHLEQLAFQAMKSHRLTISEREVNDIDGSSHFSVLQVGLLVPQIRDSSSVTVDNFHTFVHRTFQEYLCACYLVRTLDSEHANDRTKEVLQFIGQEKYNLHAQNIFRLFFDLTRSTACTEQFWSAVDNEPLDLVGLRHCSRIAHWFPRGSCAFNLEEQKKIEKRTTDAIETWIWKTDRRAHDHGNRFIFDSLADTTGQQCWFQAWRTDLFTVGRSERRYFLSCIWSKENIEALKNVYDTIPREKLEDLQRLIMTGPTKFRLSRLKLDHGRFVFADDQKEALQAHVRHREPVTTLIEFEQCLNDYTSFALLNRRSAAVDLEIWTWKIAPSAFQNITAETLTLLLKQVEDDPLFFRYFQLPVVTLLRMFISRQDLDHTILSSLIVLIAMSSSCLLTTSPDHRSIQVYENSTLTSIDMDEDQYSKLMDAFQRARGLYGYSCFLPT